MKVGVLIALVLALVAGSADAGRRPPIVRVASMEPLAVQGARFRARERVSVTYVGAVRRQRKIVTSRTGSFKTTFQSVAIDPCSAFSISALGASGDRASTRHKPLPACAPA